MSPHRLRTATPQSGFSLTELMVAVAISGLLLLLLVQSMNTDGKYHSRLKNAERLQKFTFAIENLTFDQQVLTKINDPLMANCLNRPCDRDCARQSKWKDIEITGLAELRRYRPNPMSPEIENAGSFYRRNMILCEALPLEAGEPPLAKPRFPADCQFNVKAKGRIGPHHTYEILVTAFEAPSQFTHQVLRKIPLNSSTRFNNCPDNLALYCNAVDSYFLAIDPREQSMVCANPQSEVNYE